MKARFHEWLIPGPMCNTVELLVEIPDDPTDRDLIVAYELMLNNRQEPNNIDDEWSPAVDSDHEGRLFWMKADGQWSALFVEFVEEDE